MYRKIALTSVTLNVAFALLFLGVFIPKLCDLFKNLKVEMPWWMMWLINAAHFVTSPLGFVASLLLIGFFGVKVFGKRANIGA